MYALGNYNAPSTNFTAKTLILWISSVALSYSITIGTPETYIHRKKKHICAIHPLKIYTANLIIRLHKPITIFFIINTQIIRLRI